MAKALDVHRGDGEPTPTTNPSSILGTDTVAPLTMATAYAGIANQGTVCTPIAIAKVVGTDGKQVNVPASQCKQGVPTRAGKCQADILWAADHENSFADGLPVQDLP